MKQYGTKAVVIVLIACLFTSLFLAAVPAAAQANFDVNAESAILVDAETGTILFEKNADLSLPPASMSKMMTEYLVLEALSQGQFDWDTVVVASEYAHYLGGLDGTSRVWLALGEERTVEELYTAMAVYSANDATVALAELVAGSEERFVQMMNEKAAELGMTNSTFVNSTGLPNRMLGPYMHTGQAEDENAMSARDTAILAQALVKDYPEVLRFSSIPSVEPGEGKGHFDVRLLNFNWMLAGHPQPDAKPHAYQGLDGLKTGYTQQAGYCFTGTAERDGMRLISVVMRSDSMASRFQETRKLLDYGFNNFKTQTLLDKGDTIEGFETLPVANGKQKEVPVALGAPLELIIHKDDAEAFSIKVIPHQELTNGDGLLEAPLAEGDVVGYARLVYEGSRQYGTLDGKEAVEVPLVAMEEVEKAGWLRTMMRGIGALFSGAWSKVVDGLKNWFS
ncbi:D-alanyl-D-alanine carboxypeptidase [Caldalkalibacillus thermarum]|uniref:D-alanyl-D-alanine carboxypeptidase family protein n=1 Tax=Caldalkalibacillus thermarum TaxID=296745 RepID=UPI001667B48E|nr:D-alanyl-D-alanine carboxypeptidase family protein [Caldalkalibacillus thermarum]GGK35872.1 D-alanyl-D-alanine carboxypeptidase [Caldalkalibacillus thermarum]